MTFIISSNERGEISSSRISVFVTTTGFEEKSSLLLFLPIRRPAFLVFFLVFFNFFRTIFNDPGADLPLSLPGFTRYASFHYLDKLL